MQFVFTALICVFTGIYAFKESTPVRQYEDGEIVKLPKHLRVLFSRLFFRCASGIMAVMIAAASRTGVRTHAYFVLVIIGLCASLAADIFFVLAGRWKKYRAAGLSFSSAAGIFYIAAFYTYAPFSWRDIILFVLIITPAAAALYNREYEIVKRLRYILYGIVLGAVSAKAVSMLFFQYKGYIYAVLAAAGALLFSLSNFAHVHKGLASSDSKALRAARAIIYYCGQALLALSVMI